MRRLTTAQADALRYLHADKTTATPPRVDVLKRLEEMGLVELRRAWVHVGLTIRSRQRFAIVDRHLTAEGRRLAADLAA